MTHALTFRTSLATVALLLSALAHAQVPAGGTPTAPTSWKVDPAQSTLEFLFTQAGGKNTGRFTRFSGTVEFSPQTLATAKADVSVDLASVDTRDADRDGSLKSADFFDVGKFATAKFTATKFTSKGTSFEAAGTMTFHGVTKPVVASFTWSPATEAGKTVAWLKGTFPFKRTDFGVGGSDAESLKWLPPEITVSFNLHLAPAAAAPAAAASPATQGAPASAAPMNRAPPANKATPAK